jgi:hypothetical protein
MRIFKRSDRRQLVDLQDVPETAIDINGQPSLAATTIGTFHASVRQLKGDEMLNVRQIWPTATHLVEIGWLGSAIPVTADNPAGLIVPSMKLLLRKNGAPIRVLNVLAADNVDEENQVWRITAEENVGETS